jgi:hypothetical protein
MKSRKLLIILLATILQLGALPAPLTSGEAHAGVVFLTRGIWKGFHVPSLAMGLLSGAGAYGAYKYCDENPIKCTDELAVLGLVLVILDGEPSGGENSKLEAVRKETQAAIERANPEIANSQVYQDLASAIITEDMIKESFHGPEVFTGQAGFTIPSDKIREILAPATAYLTPDELKNLERRYSNGP